MPLTGLFRSSFLLSLLALAPALFAPEARAGSITLTFEDVSLPSTGVGSLSGPYLSQGFSLASTSGFSARGPGTDSANYTPDTSDGSGTVTTSLAAFAPGTITLTSTTGTPFSLDSIDLAREFRFNTPNVGQAYPVVTFTGTKEGGATVTETFTADQVGFFFRTFTFTPDFSDLTSVSWTQPAFTSGTPTDPAPGLHQFDNIVLATVPEPASLTLMATAVAVAGLGLARRRTGQGASTR